MAGVPRVRAQFLQSVLGGFSQCIHTTVSLPRSLARSVGGSLPPLVSNGNDASRGMGRAWPTVHQRRKIDDHPSKMVNLPWHPRIARIWNLDSSVIFSPAESGGHARRHAGLRRARLAECHRGGPTIRRRSSGACLSSRPRAYAADRSQSFTFSERWHPNLYRHLPNKFGASPPSVLED